MNLNTRLRQLEARTPPIRCTTCHDWPPTLLLGTDGRRSDPHPERCPDCGRERRVYLLEGSDDDDEQQMTAAYQAIRPSACDPFGLEALTDAQLDDLGRLIRRMEGQAD